MGSTQKAIIKLIMQIILILFFIFFYRDYPKALPSEQDFFYIQHFKKGRPTL